MATLIGLPSRILWGYISSRWMSPNKVLALLGFVTTISVALTGLNSLSWPTWALLSVAVAVNATASGWQGVTLSEIARRAPPGQVGAITGSVISLSCIGQIILPPLFAAVLLLTNSYALGFALVSIPPSIIGVMLLQADRRAATKAVK
jgi:nitrate/nitrite transporter NarK